MARPISVKLERQEERRALAELSLREYREPADQAAYLIVDGLRRAGMLTDRASEQPPAEAS
jgi:hypothetical protein